MSKHIRQWFISDLHFDHWNILHKFVFRPFKDTDEMNEKLIENWNKVVAHDDIVYVLGDVYLGGNIRRISALVTRLNGYKILVRGNHDYKHKQMMARGFVSCVDSIATHINGEYVLLSHYPYRDVKKKLLFKIKEFFGLVKSKKYSQRYPDNKGKFLIHGHTHSEIKMNGKMINVCVEAWNYKPVSEGQIASLIDNYKRTKYGSK